MKKMSRGALSQSQVIHRCYAYWMLGVLLDHYCLCGMHTDKPYCVYLGLGYVKPWTEMLVRSVGNFQDMFGFLILGAYQDSLNSKNKQIRFRQADLLILILYLGLWLEGFRWYFLVMLQARLILVIGSLMRVPALLQILSMLLLWLLPDRFFPVVDTCNPSWNLSPLQKNIFRGVIQQAFRHSSVLPNLGPFKNCFYFCLCCCVPHGRNHRDKSNTNATIKTCVWHHCCRSKYDNWNSDGNVRLPSQICTAQRECAHLVDIGGIHCLHSSATTVRVRYDICSTQYDLLGQCHAGGLCFPLDLYFFHVATYSVGVFLHAMGLHRPVERRRHSAPMLSVADGSGLRWRLSTQMPSAGYRESGPSSQQVRDL